MDLSRRKRPKITYSADVTETYPQEPNFYWKPPTGEITLCDMEDIASERLQSKVILHIVKTRISLKF